MMTVNAVSKLTGVSVRTLHYYDEIGLLCPAVTTDAGYRLYDEESLERLQQILLFRELEFPLKEIQTILESPAFDKQKALSDQIRLLKLKQEHLEGLISLAEKLKETGGNTMDFKPFDRTKMDAYKEQAKKEWGHTQAFSEYEEKSASYTEKTEQTLVAGLMKIFKEFGNLREKDPEDSEVQSLVKTLQAYISEHFYTCTKEILAGLGQMYVSGGEMTENIDAAGGPGTARLASAAIKEYCK